MSEHQQSDDELKLWMKNLPSDDLMVWLKDIESRVHRMCDDPGNNQQEMERTFEELGNMSQGLLFLSRSLLEMAKIANNARVGMVKPSMEENEQQCGRAP